MKKANKSSGFAVGGAAVETRVDPSVGSPRGSSSGSRRPTPSPRGSASMRGSVMQDQHEYGEDPEEVDAEEWGMFDIITGLVIYLCFSHHFFLLGSNTYLHILYIR